jgi:hypothetical protein
MVGEGVGVSVGAPVGTSVGASVGDAVGVFVGASVGAFVGDAVGVFVGASVGAFVGDAVGLFVGASVGASVGDAVGVFVGASVGAFVGDAVGVFVGAAVGAFVGASVGAFVGDAVGVFVGASESERILPSASASAKRAQHMMSVRSTTNKVHVLKPEEARGVAIRTLGFPGACAHWLVCVCISGSVFCVSLTAPNMPKGQKRPLPLGKTASGDSSWVFAVGLQSPQPPPFAVLSEKYFFFYGAFVRFSTRGVQKHHNFFF